MCHETNYVLYKDIRLSLTTIFDYLRQYYNILDNCFCEVCSELQQQKLPLWYGNPGYYDKIKYIMATEEILDESESVDVVKNIETKLQELDINLPYFDSINVDKMFDPSNLSKDDAYIWGI